jgi:hypothetical protein
MHVILQFSHQRSHSSMVWQRLVVLLMLVVLIVNVYVGNNRKSFYLFVAAAAAAFVHVGFVGLGFVEYVCEGLAMMFCGGKNPTGGFLLATSWSNDGGNTHLVEWSVVVVSGGGGGALG